MRKLKFYLEEANLFTEFVNNNMDFSSTTKEECDVIISSSFPVGIFNKKEIQKKIDSYKNEKKLVVIFMISDNESKFQLYPNIVLFRTSLKKSKRDWREYVLPYIWECFSEPLEALEKTEKPIIGFCGSIKKNLGKRLSCIETIQKNEKLISNFILRTDFWGGKPQDKQLKEDFKKNIKTSHFNLSNRGRGNFSMRFYQVLSLGRIPVLLDSDMLLPFEEEINWNRYCITAKNENELSSAITAWWQNKSAQDVIEVQKDCYTLFQNYFTEKKFANKAMEIISERFENYDPNAKINDSLWTTFLSRLKL
ncbi:hypothetical protein EQG63_06440 [Flavobacterium amnicola]|uniref:Exostosin GT47 domain-containing protein n=1 Tax=Flavobacterium amnicola TaxID=2506422 RepID=A0A4Q1K2W7_9FLAO|nr:exostosin family protein [Flavobacterium amnicola]RXR19079.1 hypothetical protein EQG63_06440 [Flavobacterium amnicola]